MKTVDIKKHQIHVYAVRERNILTAKVLRRKKLTGVKVDIKINVLPFVLQNELY